MENLYETFQYTRFHGLVPLPFLGALHTFFDGKIIDQVKNALNEPYNNCSYAILSFLTKGSTLINKDRKERENEKKVREILDKTHFTPNRIEVTLLSKNLLII